MKRFSWLAAAAVAALAAGCAGSARTEAETSTTAATTAPSAATQTQTGEFTDAQLTAYLAARAEIEPIQQSFGSLTPEQQAQASAQITEIIERHGLSAVTYDAIGRRAQSDADFANRLTGLQPGTFSDANLRAFAAAAVEIEPINRTLAAATPEQRAQAAEQLRAILERHNLDGATYNAIAARAQEDPAFAARISALHTQSQSSEE